MSGGRALGAALRGYSTDQQAQKMVDDARAELLNMMTGQFQTDLKIDQPLGLGRPTSLSELSQGGGGAFEHSIVLTGDN